jgi:hypothetical protein
VEGCNRLLPQEFIFTNTFSIWERFEAFG